MRASNTMTKQYGQILELMFGKPNNCTVSFQAIETFNRPERVEHHVVMTFKEPIRNPDHLIEEITKVVASSSAYQRVVEKLEKLSQVGPEDKAQKALKLLNELAEFVKET